MSDRQPSLSKYESKHLAELIGASRAANAAISSFVQELLAANGLDPAKYGISPDLSHFVNLEAEAKKQAALVNAQKGLPTEDVAIPPVNGETPAPEAVN